MVLVPLAAILFQVYLPRFFQYLRLSGTAASGDGLLRADAPAAHRRTALRRARRAWAGFAESQQPLGMFGIVKTLVGYFAASVSMRFDVDNPLIQFLLGFFFFFFHQFFYWVLSRALLGQQIDFNPQQTFLFGLLNAAVALPLFMLLDRMRE